MASREMTISIRFDGLSYDASSQKVTLHFTIQGKPCDVDWPEGPIRLSERANELGLTLPEMAEMAAVELLAKMKGAG